METWLLRFSWRSKERPDRLFMKPSWCPVIITAFSEFSYVMAHLHSGLPALCPGFWNHPHRIPLASLPLSLLSGDPIPCDVLEICPGGSGWQKMWVFVSRKQGWAGGRACLVSVLFSVGATQVCTPMALKEALVLWSVSLSLTLLLSLSMDI